MLREGREGGPPRE
jgi:hypothetical protein